MTASNQCDRTTNMVRALGAYDIVFYGPIDIEAASQQTIRIVPFDPQRVMLYLVSNVSVGDLLGILAPDALVSPIPALDSSHWRLSLNYEFTLVQQEIVFQGTAAAGSYIRGYGIRRR